MASPNLTEIATTTIKNYSSTLADNVLTHNPVLAEMRKRGNVRPASGGEKILENLMYAENSTFKFYSGYEALDVSASDTLTSAEYEWKQANCNVVISGLEQLQNSGREAMHNLLRSRIKVAEKTMQNQIASSLFSNGTGTGGKEITGLQAAVADSPTSGIYGGINRANYSFWQNKVYDFSSAVSTAASSSNIQAGMNKLWLQLVRGSDKPDMIIFDDDYYNNYWTSLQANQRFTSDKDASAGFENLSYKGGTKVFYDSNCPDKHGYFLNMDYLFWRPHPSKNFTTSGERLPTNQDALVIPLFFAGNLTCSNASLQGVMKD